jgi:6-phosphogluconolactonase
MPSIVNKAASIIFLVIGSEKAQALGHIIEGPYKPTVYPAQLIRPEKGELYWFSDEAAAKEITRRQ